MNVFFFLPIAEVVPSVSQESILLWDILQCLKGIDGSYIISEPLTSPYSPVTFKISPDVGMWCYGQQCMYSDKSCY